jgi:hypothetical protein
MPVDRYTGAVPCIVRTVLCPFCLPPHDRYETPYNINFHSELLRILRKATAVKTVCKHCSWWIGCDPNPYPHFLFYHLSELRGTRWCNGLRHCAASRKDAVSIPDGANEIFHWHNPSGPTMALASTQPLTEMSTRNISWGSRRPVRRADNLTTFMCWLSWNLGASTSWNRQGMSRSVKGLLYLCVSELHFPNLSVLPPLNFDLQCTVLLFKKGTMFLKMNW